MQEDNTKTHQSSHTKSNKKLSCRRKAARCFVFVCSQLQHTAQFFLLVVTAASDLLVHKILLNFVLLSPIVSGGVRPKLPGQTSLHHNQPCFLPLEGQLGSGPRIVDRIGSGVRVSASPQKFPHQVLSYTAAKNGNYDLGGFVRG